jgi:uncharacterized protein YbjQ (UPF0145 family)
MSRSPRSLALLSLPCFLLGTGCATSRLEDPQFRAQVAKLKVYETDESLPSGSRIIGTVKGMTCKRNAYATDELKQSTAFLQMKQAAVNLRADAVANVVCEEQGTSFATNCWKSIACYGDAIKFSTP